MQSIVKLHCVVPIAGDLNGRGNAADAQTRWIAACPVCYDRGYQFICCVIMDLGLSACSVGMLRNSYGLSICSDAMMSLVNVNDLLWVLSKNITLKNQSGSCNFFETRRSFTCQLEMLIHCSRELGEHDVHIDERSCPHLNIIL